MSSQRILRNYHNMTPGRFHALNQIVKAAISDKSRFSDSIWVGHEETITSYIATSEKHDSVYHESLLGNKLVIAERAVLQVQLVGQLDEIAALLEIAAMQNADLLLGSGFELSKERRGGSRGKANAAAHNAANAAQEEGQGNTSA